MRKFVCLYAIISFCFTSCDNESIDDALLDLVDQPGGPGNTSLVGDWMLQSLDYNGTTTTTAAGLTISSDFVGASANENFDVTFNADGTFITNGSYDIVLTATTQGITTTDTQTITGGSVGNYTATSSTLTTTTALFAYNVDVTSGTDPTQPQTSDYVLSPDGQTMTFDYTYNETINQAGATVVISVTGTTVLVRDNSGTNNPTSIDGTWLLTAWNTADAFDLNNDGTPSINVLDEMNCYTNETLILNTDNTGSANSTSYAEITAELVVGTTNQFTYTISCIQDNETTNLTWSQTGSTVSLTDTFGTTDWTLSGSTLSLTIPDGFEVYESDGITISTTSDLTFVYTKQ